MQRMCVGWFRLQYPAVGKLLFAVPNGGARSRTEAAIMKAEGVTAGVTDLILLLGRGGFNALCIEMKTTDRRSALSDAQIEWRSLTIANGNRHVVCRTLEEFQSEIRWYMARPANTVDLAKQIIGYVYGADERNRPTNESPSNDAEFLEWLYVRLVGTHGENPNTDFMQNLNSIIEKLR